MKITTAIRNAWKTYTADFGSSMKFLAVELCIVLAAAAPALFLWEESTRFLALIAVLLFILLVFPARMNAARTMRNALNGGKLCSYQLVDCSSYGKDLVDGVLRMGLILLWSIPLIASVVLAKHYISVGTDGMTLLHWVSDFGGGGRDGIPTGVFRLLLIVLATLLLAAAGCGFHSADRHCMARGKKDLIRGHHGKNLLCWLIAGLLTLAPVIIAIAVAIMRYVPYLADMNGLINDIMKGKVDLPDTKTTLIIVAIGAVLTLPLLPLRSLITAAFVDGLEKQ